MNRLSESSSQDLLISVGVITRGTGTPKDKDEVNRREVCECDG
jgi:hypothetical protein